MSDTDTDYYEIIYVPPKKRLFNYVSSEREGASLNDVDTYQAVTLNIQPTKLMNKKPWKDYNHDQQRAQLLRIESRFRSRTPSCELIEMHFEVCPNLKNIHYHALYKMPKIYVSEMYNYFKRICSSTDSNTVQEWRFIDIKQINSDQDKSSWLTYIRKDVDK